MEPLRRFRVSFLLFVCVVTLATIGIRRAENRLLAQTEQTILEVQVENDLNLDTGSPAVVLHCDPAVLTAAILDGIHCTAINNSSKEIRALVASLNVTGDAKSQPKKSRDHVLFTETFLHTDFNESHLHRAIGPVQSTTIDSAPITRT